MTAPNLPTTVGDRRSRQLAAHLPVAAASHGVLTTAELLTAGLTSGAIEGLCRDGILERVHRGVHRVAGAPASWQQQLVLACRVAAGGVASHRSALLLHGMSWPERGILEITVPRRSCPSPPGVVRHRSRDLDPSWVEVLDGVPATTVDRTLLDLAAVVGPVALERAVEEALVRRRTTVAELWLCLESHARRGRPGVRSLRRVLAGRGLGDDPADSVLEAVVATILVRGGLPRPVAQHEVVVGGRRRRLDFAYPELRIAIELDGYAFHAGREVFEDDRRRQNDLELAGWLVLRFTWRQVQERPDAVVAAIARAIDARRKSPRDLGS